MENNRQFQLNVWDFGGQHIYYATHQFFLTRRSLWCTFRQQPQQTANRPMMKPSNEWLDIIETLSNNSPVLVYQNQVGG